MARALGDGVKLELAKNRFRTLRRRCAERQWMGLRRRNRSADNRRLDCGLRASGRHCAHSSQFVYAITPACGVLMQRWEREAKFKAKGGVNAPPPQQKKGCGLQAHSEDDKDWSSLCHTLHHHFGEHGRPEGVSWLESGDQGAANGVPRIQRVI